MITSKFLRNAAIAGSLAFCSSIAMAANAVADVTPDLRGVWSSTHTVVGLPNENSDGAPRFNQSEWILEIREQEDNVFWGTSSWSRIGSERWNEAQVTGSLKMDGSGDISMLESRGDTTHRVNGLVDATFENGKIYADFRSLHSGITYSAVLERDSTG